MKKLVIFVAVILAAAWALPSSPAAAERPSTLSHGVALRGTGAAGSREEGTAVVVDGSVAGQVNGMAGGLGGIYVVLSPADTLDLVAYAITGPDGSYSMPVVPVGTYKTLILDPDQLQGQAVYYVSQFLGGGTSFADFPTASTITVGPAESVVLPTVTLTHSTRTTFAGVVTDGIDPVPGMYVVVTPSDVPAITAYAVTAADGTWALPNLPSGSYKVLTVDLTQLAGNPSYYISEFYDDGGTTLPDYATATVIVGAAGASITLNPVVLGHT
jgi:hypothetical protein